MGKIWTTKNVIVGAAFSAAALFGGSMVHDNFNASAKNALDKNCTSYETCQKATESAFRMGANTMAFSLLFGGLFGFSTGFAAYILASSFTGKKEEAAAQKNANDKAGATASPKP